MAMTPDGQIWYPGITDTGELNTLLATLASSLENGLVPRIKVLESFIGVNLGLDTPSLTDGSVTTYPFAVEQSWNFNNGMAVSSGIVTMPFTGMYQISFNANFLPVSATAPRINTYIYKNGTSIQYSSAYGEASTIRYTNCTISNVFKLNAGDTIDVRASSLGVNSNLQAGAGSSLGITLVSRT